MQATGILLRSAFAGLIGLALLTSPAQAHTKDMRSMSSNADPEVGFCSRPSPDKFGFPGHAFVTFSERRSDDSRNFRAVGHTVAFGTSAGAAALTYFGGTAVAGQQAEERYTSIKQHCLTVKVDKSAYDAALAAAQPTLTALGIPADVAASAERYSLKNNDCVTFARRVALALEARGLSVPVRSSIDTPASWIGKLTSANP